MVPLPSLCCWHWEENWLGEPKLSSHGPRSLLEFCKMTFSGCFNLCCYSRQRSRFRAAQMGRNVKIWFCKCHVLASPIEGYPVQEKVQAPLFCSPAQNWVPMIKLSQHLLVSNFSFDLEPTSHGFDSFLWWQ